MFQLPAQLIWPRSLQRLGVEHMVNRMRRVVIDFIDVGIK